MKKIYNKNAREKALLEEAYGAIYERRNPDAGEWGGGLKGVFPGAEEGPNFDEEEELSVPDISGLDFDIQGSLKVSKSSIGDIMSVSDGNENPHVPTEIKAKSKRVSKKKFMEQFKKEAGSLREGG